MYTYKNYARQDTYNFYLETNLSDGTKLICEVFEVIYAI